MAANVYDFDHTIYRGDASLDFILFCLRRHPLLLRYLPRQTWEFFLYILGERSRKQFKQVAFLFLKSLKNVDNELEIFWNSHETKVESWYLDQKKSSDVIVSASPEFLLAPIAQRLGVNELVATRMSKTTGKITGENCRAEEKVRRLAKSHPKLAVAGAYSDSLSDLPLLRLAKNAYVVKKGVVSPLSPSAKHSDKNLLRELLLYGLIGGSTAALDVILFEVFRHFGIWLLLANLLSVSIAIGSSFLLNAKYNFKKTDKLRRRAAKFFSIGYFGWFIQSVILWLGVEIIGIEDTGVKIFAVLFVAAIQYVLNKFLTFKN